MNPSARHDEVLDQLAIALDRRCGPLFNLVLIDGIPASGKSSLSHGLEARLADKGRQTSVIENDWFIARGIRNPLSIALGLALALSPVGIDRIERKLLERFLDGERLAHLHRDLKAARSALREGRPAIIRPEGAFWNLRHPPAWSSVEAAEGLTLQPGGVLLIEGTLTRATWQPHFPDLTSIFVHVPVPVARHRFLERNQHRHKRRNRAFTALARNELAFRLAADMLGRNRAEYDFEIDLRALEHPIITRSPPTPSTT